MEFLLTKYNLTTKTMTTKLNNNNLQDIRRELTKRNVITTNDLAYYLIFGFKDDVEYYEFDMNELKIN
jgi:precorrin isomerase